MERAVSSALLLVLVVGLAVFTFYIRIDRKRYFARLYFDRNVDDCLIDWLRAARALEGELPAEEGFWQDLDREIDLYDDAPSWKPERRVEGFNRIHSLFTDLRRRSPDSEDFARIAAPLNELRRGFIERVDTYNFYARSFNESLDSGVGAVLRDVFRIKGLADLEDPEL